jgi:tRNA nucleotidyltransferase (CCA-adding enzyme)
MEIYLVGGAVRDKLLNYPVHERDWVVVGATPQDLLNQGYRQVGKDFPVFLHPESAEEYALARTERKTGPGYTGFSCYSAPDVTLEQDLLRRDFTINAIAEDSNGNLIDPYGGQQDIKKKRLRHVSANFVEDPLRVLRAARFAARYHHLGFSIAPETMDIMATIVTSNELSHLAAERVWTEMEKSLAERSPEVFIEVLRNCGALKALFPEIDCLFGVPQTEKHHPEIDTGKHILLCLIEAAKISPETCVRFAVLLHDLDKGTTPEQEWPRHIAHEHRGLDIIKSLCQRIKASNEHRDLALLVCQYHSHCHRASELTPKTILKTLEGLDAFRRSERFEQFLLCCEADSRGRQGLQDRDYPQTDMFRRAFQAALSVDNQQLLNQGHQGKALGEAIRQARIEAISKEVRP